MAGIGFELKKLVQQKRAVCFFPRLWICRDYLYRSHVAWYRTSAGGYVFV